MNKRILSASISAGKEIRTMAFRPGINILFGQHAEEVILTLAGIFGGIPPKSFEAVLHWQEGITLFVSGADGSVFVDGINTAQGDPAWLMKAFHKRRFLNFRNKAHLLDGAQLPEGTSGVSDLLLKKLSDTLAKEDDRPIFIYNFLERLDEASEQKPIFEALLATGRQVFIAVPHYYNIKPLEEMLYDIHIL